MKISNPQAKFDRVTKDAQGEDAYGYRDTFGQEEIVDLKTGHSNMTFYKPEKVFSAAGCQHDFKVDDMGKREFVCSTCSWGVTVNTQDISEDLDGMWIKIKQGRFRVSE